MSGEPLEVLVEAIAEAVARKIVERAPAATPPPSPTAENEWLDTRAAARYLGYKPKTLAEWREKGEGPLHHRIGRRSIRYARRDLEAFARTARAAKARRP